MYSSHEEFVRELREAFPRGSRVAAQFSARFPISSFLDHGMASSLQTEGIDLVPSENLVSRCLGSLDDEGLSSHRRAAVTLYEIVHTAWNRVIEAGRSGATLHEGEIRDWMVSLIMEHRLQCDNPPLVAAGRGSSDPHYTPQGDGQILERGDVVQFDIWAKERSSNAVYADISWVGVLGAEPDSEARSVFDAVVKARESAVELIQGKLREGQAVTGAEVDRAARAILIERGYERGIRHRTGHSIGGRVHGFGVNLDSVEFPDERPLGEGMCFSIEPGIYLDGFGMRTEINGYIRDGRLVISGSDRQTGLLVTE
jgi:Xaa-Pro aminopeptidase